MIILTQIHPGGWHPAMAHDREKGRVDVPPEGLCRGQKSRTALAGMNASAARRMNSIVPGKGIGCHSLGNVP